MRYKVINLATICFIVFFPLNYHSVIIKVCCISEVSYNYEKLKLSHNYDAVPNTVIIIFRNRLVRHEVNSTS